MIGQANSFAKCQKPSAVLGVVLAGGKSSRMGQDKGALCIGNRTLVTVAYDQLLASGVDDVVISSNQIKTALADKIANCGPLSAIHSIVHEHRVSHYQGMVVLPIDMPLIQSAQLRQLREYGQAFNTACCYQQCYLPAYIPITAQLSKIVDEQMASQNYALKSLLKKLQFKQLTRQPSAEKNQTLCSFYNINTADQWQAFQQATECKPLIKSLNSKDH